MATNLPEHFKCPISLEIMSDPVILSSGHTFDRPSIQRWLDEGHRTCPITKLPLPDSPILIPNHALRSLISSYTLLPPLHQIISQPETLISTLILNSSSSDSKIDSLRQLARLSKRDASFRRRLVDSEGAIDRVVNFLVGAATSDCRALAATIITSLAVVEVNKATIGAFPGAIEALVMILRDGKGREKKEAATALYALCCFRDNRKRAVDCGAVPILLRNVESGLERGVEVIGVLAKCKEGREQLESYGGCAKILVSVLRNGSSRGIQYALLALTLVCLHSKEILMMTLQEGVLEICIGMVEDNSEKVRRNASNLIRVLRGGNHHRIS
ncbi:putative aminoacyltransferase, E1 ubiquitin-activating enzyme [Medicago truncatula]|uniref:RING-type E3 ubiquitin transferase n=1 Tax=Medicago truncatula TaxID=3880 RepID=A0A396ICP5_MEDTR|nr:U-box domain-containing protein 8 isoform X3 [Medicago truncatula]RHN62563.1 putative aminoacyltransferase, E1 ubiquitin-activating enzyme [Medicago truncatula]